MGALDIGITIKLLVIAVALILASVCLFYAGEISGFELGYDRAIEVNSTDKTKYEFSVSGPTVYEYNYETYSGIAFWLYLYVLGKTLRNRFYSRLVCIFSIAPTIYLFWQLIQYKIGLPDPGRWTTKTIKFDWEGLAIVSVILIVELIFLAVWYFKGKPDLVEEIN